MTPSTCQKPPTCQKKSLAVTVNPFAQVRENHATELAEDYLELIEDLIQRSGEARAVDIAATMGVRQVTVTKAIGRLKREGLVTAAPYRSIFLTEEGKKIAKKARQRHRTVREFLVTLGVDPSVAEIDAEGIEHHTSPPTLIAMQQFIDQQRADCVAT